jgi:hypothetical protein
VNLRVRHQRGLISRLSDRLSESIRDVWLVWLVLAVATTAPYVIAVLGAPSGSVFTGTLTAYDDTFTYFAWTRQSADGRLLMCDLFTSESQECRFFLPLWSALGLVVRITHAPIAFVFHLARILAALLLLLVARAVAKTVIKSRTRIQYFLWLYATSAGFGWLVYLLKSKVSIIAPLESSGSIDLNVPEGTAFRSVFGQVHFAVGVALLAMALKLFFDALIEERASRAFAAGALISILAVVHPYIIVVALAVSTIALLCRKWITQTRSTLSRELYVGSRLGVSLGVGAVPGVAYLVYVNRSSEVLREWLRVTDTVSPAPWEYVVGFGIVFLTAVAGFWIMWSERSQFGLMLLIWTLVQAALLYAPISFQRRFVEGLQLPLTIAAAVAIFRVADTKFQQSHVMRRKTLLVAIILLASITNIGFIAGQLLMQRNNIPADSRRYISADLVAAFSWLNRTPTRDAVVFSSYLTGNLAPSMTGLRVYLGHYGQTINSDQKGAQVTAFFTGAMTDEDARRLFREQRVSYVVYGEFERAISRNFVPPAWLSLAFRAGDVEVFEVSSET